MPAFIYSQQVKVLSFHLWNLSNAPAQINPLPLFAEWFNEQKKTKKTKLLLRF